MVELPLPLTALSEVQRTQALEHFKIMRPTLELAGLADAGCSHKGISRNLPPNAITLIEELTLQTPPPSTAAIHRQETTIASEQRWKPPTYARAHQIIRKSVPY